MSAANLTKSHMDLARVAMPLVRLMRDGGLSRAQKEEIASVILQLCAEQKDWEKEAAHLAGAIGSGLAASGFGISK
jgi:hypothetical protein